MGAFAVAAVQLAVHDTLDEQLLVAAGLIAEAAGSGAKLILLPERFAQWLPEMEPESADTSRRLAGWLAEQACRHAVYLAGGSLLERIADQRLPFNTCLLFGPDGAECGRYRKIHLFDALVENVNHGESSTVAAGHAPVCAHTPLAPIGLSICYDLRFPELYRALVDQGATILLVPAGFTRVTGLAHWEVLLRARAIENQCFVVAAGMVGRTAPTRDFFGHSMVVGPWGQVLACREEGQGIVLASVDLDEAKEVRQRLPALLNRRLGLTAKRPAQTGSAGR